MKEYDTGERIRKSRIRNGISQEELAERMGCSSNAVSNWENGKSEIKSGNLARVAKMLGSSADYILGLQEEVNLDTEISDMICLLSEEKQRFAIRIFKAIIREL